MPDFARAGFLAKSNGERYEEEFLAASSAWPRTCLIKQHVRIIIGKDRKPIIVGKSWVDYAGTVAGVPVAIEIKSATGSKWSFREKTGSRGSTFPKSERDALVLARRGGHVALVVLHEETAKDSGWYSMVPDRFGLVDRSLAVPFLLRDFPRIIDQEHRKIMEPKPQQPDLHP